MPSSKCLAPSSRSSYLDHCISNGASNKLELSLKNGRKKEKIRNKERNKDSNQPGNSPNGSGFIAMIEIFGRLPFLEARGFQVLIDSSMASHDGEQILFFLLLLLKSLMTSLNCHQGSLLSFRTSEATARGKKCQNSLKQLNFINLLNDGCGTIDSHCSTSQPSFWSLAFITVSSVPLEKHANQQM